MITNAHIQIALYPNVVARAQYVCVFLGSGTRHTARYTAAIRKPKLTQKSIEQSNVNKSRPGCCRPARVILTLISGKLPLQVSFASTQCCAWLQLNGSPFRSRYRTSPTINFSSPRASCCALALSSSCLISFLRAVSAVVVLAAVVVRVSGASSRLLPPVRPHLSHHHHHHSLPSIL